MSAFRDGPTIEVGYLDRSYGRNAHCCTPPAQIRTWHLHRFLGFLMETGRVQMPAEVESGGRVVEAFLQTLAAQGYGEVSADCRSGQQRGLRRVLRILGRGVGSESRYEWTDHAEFERLVHQLHEIRKSLCP